MSLTGDGMKTTSTKENNLDFNKLMTDLEQERETDFLHGLISIAGSSPNQLPILFQAADANNSLLTLACAKGLTNAVETIIRLGADINATIDTERGPLTSAESACRFGNWKVLEILIKSPMLDISKCNPLLSIVVKNIGEKKDTTTCDYKMCFQMLLDHKDIDVNQLDAHDCSALHYAVQFNNSDAILELMKHGAFIGPKNLSGQLPLNNINPDVLEQHFDSCISTNGCRPDEDDFEIQFDYSNLVACPISMSKENGVDCSPNEMIAIEFISESNELRHLIGHPLIASFLFLKWNQLALIFYINFILCLLFAASTATFASIYEEIPDPTSIKSIMRIVSLVLTLYLIVREIAQFRLSPLTYFRRIENHMECVMIGLVIITLLDLYNENARRVIVALAVLLIGLEVFHLAGSLPFWSFSTHYVMLKTVLSSFLKSLSLYVILLLSFSLAFYTLLREKPAYVKNRGGGDEDFGELNRFNNLGLSIIKTLVMSTGEFDAADINFNLSPGSYVIFIVFLFIISTALLNLLNGLAVDDIRSIKCEAELTHSIQRCHVLTQYEKALLNNEHSCSLPILVKYFARDAISVLKRLKPTNKIGVKTNANNQISVSNIERTTCCKSCLSYFGRCAHMNERIVRLANGVLRKLSAQKFKRLTNDPLSVEIQELKASIELMKSVLLRKEIK